MLYVDDEGTYSCLIHICYKQDIHKNLEKLISNFVINLDKAIRQQSSVSPSVIQPGRAGTSAQ
ncbi:MAG: hypothetical protein RLZZ507_4484 [Cyanobacteriota bacterium]|jgi:hypothetical protein